MQTQLLEKYVPYFKNYNIYNYLRTHNPSLLLNIIVTQSAILLNITPFIYKQLII